MVSCSNICAASTDSRDIQTKDYDELLYILLGELSRHGGGRVVDSTPLAAGSNQSQTPAGEYNMYNYKYDSRRLIYILAIVYTRNELASLAHSFYTCVPHSSDNCTLQIYIYSLSP